MNPIQSSVKIAIVLSLMGLGGFYFWRGPGAAFWFFLGAMLALGNLIISSRLVEKSFCSWSRRSVILGAIFLKTLMFVLLVALALMLSKAELLPFTLGISLVIFSLLLWAIGNRNGSRAKHL